MASGRPQDFAFTVPTWATGGNYPAGANAWNGQPMRVLPGTLYFNPAAPVPAEYLNYQFGVLADTIGSLQTGINQYIDYDGQVPAFNYPYAGLVSSTSTDQIFTVIPYSGGAGLAGTMLNSWACLTLDSSSHAVKGYTSLDGGVTWTSLGVPYTGSSTVVPLCMGSIGSGVNKGKIILASNVTSTVPAGGFFNTYTASGWGTSVTGLYPCQASAQINSTTVFVGGKTTNGIIPIYSTTDGATFTDHHDSAAPANILGVSSWIAASNGTVMVCLPTSFNASLSSYQAMVSTNGTTWTYPALPTMPNPLIAFTGLTYSASDALWMATASINGSSVTDIVLTSPDGSTWTIVKTLNSFGGGIQGLVCLGSLYVATVQPTATYGIFTRTQIIYSLNAGTNWYYAPDSPLPTIYGNYPLSIANSGNQLMLWTLHTSSTNQVTYASLKFGTSPTAAT